MKHVLDKKPYQVMGILNVTPDSFSDGGQFSEKDKAIQHGLSMAADGADILDIGGQSTRPNYQEVSPAEELQRLLPVIQGIRAKSDVAISIDTYFPEVARKVLQEGADIVNDVKGMDMPEMAEVVAENDCDIVIMHWRKRRKQMSAVEDISDFFYEKIALCDKMGIRRERICLDPGIGFPDKTYEDNLQLLQATKQFSQIENCPLLIGASRKRTIAQMTGEKIASERDYASVALHLLALQQGAQIVRVHEVKGMVDALNVWLAMKNLSNDMLEGRK